MHILDFERHKLVSLYLRRCLDAVRLRASAHGARVTPHIHCLKGPLFHNASQQLSWSLLNFQRMWRDAMALTVIRK